MRRALAYKIFWSLFSVIMFVFVSGAWYLIKNSQNPILVTLTTQQLEDPRQPLVVRFSSTVEETLKESMVKITPDMGFETRWQDWGRELVIMPSANWPIGGTIELFLGAMNGSLFRRTQVQLYRIASPQLPTVTTLSPLPGSQDVLLGIEDPIRVTLDRSSKNFFLDFRLDPAVPVVYENNPDKTEFQILPQTPLQEGKEYTLEIWAKWDHAPDETYQKISDTTFTTLPPRPTSWNSDFTLRTKEALTYTRAQIREGKYIDINLAAQVMTLFENGKALDAYIVSSGKRGLDTPKGEFAIRNKADRPWSKKYGLYMPYWQAITPDGLFGIHELPEWPGGYKEGASHLGTPVSHGCVRLGVGPAKRVYEWAEIGTPVVIY